MIIYVQLMSLFIPRHLIAVGYFGITLVVCVSVHPSYIPQSVFLFPDDNLSKYQWIFTKLGMCIDIVEIGLGLLMGKFHQFLTVICPSHDNGGFLTFHVFISPMFYETVTWVSN